MIPIQTQTFAAASGDNDSMTGYQGELRVLSPLGFSRPRLLPPTKAVEGVVPHKIMRWQALAQRGSQPVPTLEPIVVETQSHLQLSQLKR